MYVPSSIYCAKYDCSIVLRTRVNSFFWLSRKPKSHCESKGDEFIAKKSLTAYGTICCSGTLFSPICEKPKTQSTSRKTTKPTK